MIKVENIEIYGWEGAFRGMRNPKNSWDKSDSKTVATVEDGKVYVHYEIGPNDMSLAKRLVAGGPVHCKFRRMIGVTMDITAPLYWWKEADTYKVGTVRDSCSTMHKITAKPFERSDFSFETAEFMGEKYADEIFPYFSGTFGPYSVIDIIITQLNKLRDLYLKHKERGEETEAKYIWRKIIELLPSSYNQKATLSLNYEVLAHMHKWRKSHPLYEWRHLCKIIETLPYAKELIIGEKESTVKTDLPEIHQKGLKAEAYYFDETSFSNALSAEVITSTEGE